MEEKRNVSILCMRANHHVLLISKRTTSYLFCETLWKSKVQPTSSGHMDLDTLRNKFMPLCFLAVRGCTYSLAPVSLFLSLHLFAFTIPYPNYNSHATASLV